MRTPLIASSLFSDSDRSHDELSGNSGETGHAGEKRAVLANLDSRGDLENRIRREERAWIARELHDSTSQLLVALQLQLMRLKETSSDARSGPFNDALCELDATLDDLHWEVRTIGERSDFNPTALADQIAGMAKKFARFTGMRVFTEIDDLPPSASPSIATTIYRVTQEALANVSRHAKAKNVYLSLRATCHSVTLRIADDGVGFCRPFPPNFAGRGITNMVTRLQEVGSNLTIRNRKRGAVVEATIELKAQDARRQAIRLVRAR